MEKIENALRIICAELSKESNRNIIIAANNRSLEDKPTKNYALFSLEMEKKKKKLILILKALKELNLIKKNGFHSIKGQIFEGIEKLSFAIKLHEMELQNNLLAYTFAKHDNIVNRVLKKWENLKFIQKKELKNLGTFYYKIERIEDFLVEVCIVGEEEICSFKSDNLNDLMLLIDYLREFFTIINNIRKELEEEFIDDINDLWTLKEINYPGVKLNTLIKILIEKFLINIIELKKNLGNLNENFLEKFENLCKIIDNKIYYK